MLRHFLFSIVPRSFELSGWKFCDILKVTKKYNETAVRYRYFMEAFMYSIQYIKEKTL